METPEVSEDMPEGAGAKLTSQDQKFRESVKSFVELHRVLDNYLVERSLEIRIGLTALVSRQHFLMLGPPGVSKTLLGYCIGLASGGPYFELLLSRFTEPPQLFGPLSVQQLVKHDTYHHNTDGFLPKARFALLDEVFKSSDAILNSILTMMNERVFHNGRVREQCPLESLIGCSNEMPESDGLSALYDRFLLRHEVSPVSDAGAMRLLTLGELPKIPKILHLEEIQRRALVCVVPDEVLNVILDIRRAALKQGIPISDRRLRQAPSVVRSSAVLAGRDKASFRDLGILGCVFWNTPDQIPAIRTIVKTAVDAHEAPVRPLNAAGRAAHAPPAAVTPPTPQELFRQAQAFVTSRSAKEADTSAWLHGVIDHLISTGNVGPNGDATLWKATISRRAPWLGSTHSARIATGLATVGAMISGKPV